MVVFLSAKWTNFRTNLYDKVTTGLHCGINLRMMRYSMFCFVQQSARTR